jgi:hypothetical protein
MYWQLVSLQVVTVLMVAPLLMKQLWIINDWYPATLSDRRQRPTRDSRAFYFDSILKLRICSHGSTIPFLKTQGMG